MVKISSWSPVAVSTPSAAPTRRAFARSSESETSVLARNTVFLSEDAV